MLIDTHCHLDAAEFDADRFAVIRAARAGGVGGFLVPAVGASNFDAVAALSAAHPDVAHAFGIHPMYVGQASEPDLDILRERLTGGGAVAVSARVASAGSSGDAGAKRASGTRAKQAQDRAARRARGGGAAVTAARRRAMPPPIVPRRCCATITTRMPFRSQSTRR